MKRFVFAGAMCAAGVAHAPIDNGTIGIRIQQAAIYSAG
jgi:hypothetical protein